MNENPAPQPQPPDDFEQRVREAYDAKDDERSLASKAMTFLLIAGGVTATAAIIVPGTTAGASRTAHLEWQRRAADISATAGVASPAVKSPQP